MNKTEYYKLVDNFKMPVAELAKLKGCTASAKAVFIDLCALYWSNAGVKSQELYRAFPDNYDEMSELMQKELIDLEEGNVIIQFLDIGLMEAFRAARKQRANAVKEITPDRKAKKELLNLDTPEEAKKTGGFDV